MKNFLLPLLLVICFASPALAETVTVNVAEPIYQKITEKNTINDGTLLLEYNDEPHDNELLLRFAVIAAGFAVIFFFIGLILLAAMEEDIPKGQDRFDFVKRSKLLKNRIKFSPWVLMLLSAALSFILIVIRILIEFWLFVEETINLIE